MYIFTAVFIVHAVCYGVYFVYFECEEDANVIDGGGKLRCMSVCSFYNVSV